MRLSRAFLLAVVLLSLLECVRQWSSAPAVMASHFDGRGVPNGYEPKGVFFAIEAGGALLIAALALGIRVMLARMPVRLINVPNREYWLSTDRRAAAVDRLTSFLETLFGATLLMMFSAFELAVAANARRPVVLDSPLLWPLLGAFLVFVICSFVWLFRSFRIPGSTEI